jgi:hypothetical protein
MRIGLLLSSVMCVLSAFAGAADPDGVDRNEPQSNEE